MADDTSRFTHLLQPIRDLAVNWDIDIASALEEYLDDLEGITVTLGEELRSAVSSGDEIESINFAEAALLIQGSALIYSKKVEYLYQLVHHTLDIVSNHKTTKAASKQIANSALAEDEAAFNEASTSFLLLDDHIKEGKDIDINDMDYDPSLHGYDTRGANAASSAKHLNSNNNPMLALLLKEKRGSSFRLNSCEVHPSGALMIGSTQSGGQISDTLEKLISPSSLYFSPNLNNNNNRSLLGSVNNVHLDGDANDNNNLVINNDDDSLDGHDDYFGGDNGNDDYDNHDLDVQTMEPMQNNHLNPSVGLFGRDENAIIKNNQNQKQTMQNQTYQPDKIVVNNLNSDPWTLLDPHDNSKLQDRPMKVGKTYKIPTLNDPRQIDILLNNENNEQTTKENKRKQTLTSSNKISKSDYQFKGLAFPEFGYLLKMDRSRKLAIKRHARLNHSDRNNNLNHLNNNDNDDLDYDDDNHVNDYGGMDFGVYGEGGDDDDDDNENDGFLPNPNAMLSQFEEAQGGNGEAFNEQEHNDAHFEDGINQLQLDNAFDEAPKSYSELCREHIAKYMQGVDRYAHESQLSMRVGEWQTRLSPMLKEQDSRRPFDIHEYGREIIRKCVDVTKDRNNQMVSNSKGVPTINPKEPIDFHKMTAEKPQFEICRLFLASLQLSNNLNVKLHHGDGVCGPDDLKLEVLNITVGEDKFNMY